MERVFLFLEVHISFSQSASIKDFLLETLSHFNGTIKLQYLYRSEIVFLFGIICFEQYFPTSKQFFPLYRVRISFRRDNDYYYRIKISGMSAAFLSVGQCFFLSKQYFSLSKQQIIHFIALVFLSIEMAFRSMENVLVCLFIVLLL